MKEKKRMPAGMWAIRGVSIAIAILVVFSFATLFYSAYVDYRGVTNSLASPENPTLARTMHGQSEVVSVNVTIPNDGLYTLQISAFCPQSSASMGVTCQPVSVTVPAGQQRILHFNMTVADLTAFENSVDHHVNGTVVIQMVPFASVSVGYDFGTFVGKAKG